MFNYLRERPWIWVVLSFIVMTGVMVGVAALANKYASKEVPVEHVRPPLAGQSQ